MLIISISKQSHWNSDILSVFNAYPVRQTIRNNYQSTQFAPVRRITMPTAISTRHPYYMMLHYHGNWYSNLLHDYDNAPSSSDSHLTVCPTLFISSRKPSEITQRNGWDCSHCARVIAGIMRRRFGVSKIGYYRSTWRPTPFAIPDLEWRRWQSRGGALEPRTRTYSLTHSTFVPTDTFNWISCTNRTISRVQLETTGRSLSPRRDTTTTIATVVVYRIHFTSS